MNEPMFTIRREGQGPKRRYLADPVAPARTQRTGAEEQRGAAAGPLVPAPTG